MAVIRAEGERLELPKKQWQAPVRVAVPVRSVGPPLGESWWCWAASAPWAGCGRREPSCRVRPDQAAVKIACWASAVVVVVYVGVTFAAGVVGLAPADDASASAIVVMGAAQWNGKPSPVLKDRLDHAAALYRAGRADLDRGDRGQEARTTVSPRGSPGTTTSPAWASPPAAVKLENQGTNSYQELSAAANILHQAGVAPDVLLVSDPYHAYRIARSPAARPVGPRVTRRRAVHGLRLRARTAAVSLGRLIGYRRLARFV